MIVSVPAANPFWRTTKPAAKQEALEAIGKLPEDTDMDEIMYRLYLLDKIRKEREAVEWCHEIRN